MSGRTIRDRDDGRQQVEEGHQQTKVKEAFLYDDNGILASTNPGWIQSAFDTLMGICDRLGLRTNVCKTVGMVCSPFWAAGVRADEAYNRRMTGEGKSLRQWERVLCLECGKEMTKGSLVTHHQNQYSVAKGGLGSEGGDADVSDRGNYPRTYRMAFPTQAGSRTFQIKGCSVQASTRTPDKGALLAPARQGHRGDSGGGQPPPPTVPHV